MPANIFILSACDAWSGHESMRILGVTTDETMLYAMIAAKIKEGDMEYDGRGEEAYRKFYQDFKDQEINLNKLKYGFVQTYDNLDASYCAAFYLLATEEALFAKACDCISVDGVDFPAMKRNCRDLNDQQKHLLSIAHSLFSWTSRCTVTPYYLSRLGYPVLDYVCSALYSKWHGTGAGPRERRRQAGAYAGYEQIRAEQDIVWPDVGPLELPYQEQEQ